ncbi:chymotrypsin-2-like [Haematobia irritans]|uniref:chymotrypsin-2-like n=1 Tax=Haematobia irritans TaxID=7368 RepID=UPI003F4F4929
MKNSFVVFLILLGLRSNQAVRLIANHSQITKGSQGRIVGGEVAEIGFAKYQISLQGRYGGHLCGGAIIGDYWVLTAAHCVDGYNPSFLRVITGTNIYFQPGAVHEVEEFWIHCNYDNPWYHNDIAILRLTEPIVFNDLTQPIPLPVTPLKDGDEVILTGWGDTVLWGDTPDNLHKLYTKFVTYENCKEIYAGAEMLDVGHICTYTRVGEGSCHGDSGGPLISNGHLVGLVNWGMPCATGTPDAHASVYYYCDWIKKVMSENCRSCECKGSKYRTAKKPNIPENLHTF